MSANRTSPGASSAPQPLGPVASRGRSPSSEELFGRRPFTYGPPLRYYGTGVAGYTSGPGFTGGYYGFGDEPAPIVTELERAYLNDLYGGGWEGAGGPAIVPVPPTPGHSAPPRLYPPGPKGYTRTDTRIREDICDRLMRTRHIDSSEVTVAVTDGKVVLEGTVPQRRMKHAIEDLADACLGVRDIDNRIRLAAPQEAG